MIKKILYVFIPVFAVLLMSHNVSAANFSYNLNDYEWKTSVNLGTQYCAYSYDTFNTTSSICILRSDRPNMYGLISYDISHKKGDLAQFFIGINDNVSSSAISGNGGLFMDNFGTIDNRYKIINIEKVVAEEYMQQEYDGSQSCSYGNSVQVCQDNNDFQDFLKLYSIIYKVSIIYTTTGSGPVGVKALNSNTPIAYCSLSNGSNSSTAQCRVRLFGYTQWEYKGSSVNQEQKQETQDAVDNSATAGGNSETSSQTATSSLLSVITSGIGAITSASPTNCKINGNMGNLNVGNIDLCANPVPTFMALIGSIIAVLVVLPLVILLFNRFISIIRSFQR